MYTFFATACFFYKSSEILKYLWNFKMIFMVRELLIIGCLTINDVD